MYLEYTLFIKYLIITTIGIHVRVSVVIHVLVYLRHWGCRGCDPMVVGFTTSCAITQWPSAITTRVVSSNLVHGDVYSIQHYVIKFVSDLRQVGGFLEYSISSTNKTDCHDTTEILLKVVFNTINQATTRNLKGEKFGWRNLTNTVIIVADITQWLGKAGAMGCLIHTVL